MIVKHKSKTYEVFHYYNKHFGAFAKNSYFIVP